MAEPPFDPMKAKAALRGEGALSGKKSARFAADVEDLREEPEEEAPARRRPPAEEAGLVKMPPQDEHTIYVLLRQPKGGLSGRNALQKLAAKLTSRFEHLDSVLVKAARSEPYLVDNGKNGKHYLVFTVQTPAKNSEAVAETLRSWPDVVGLQRMHALETMLFQAFADVYDVTEGRCIPVPPRGSGQKISLPHAPSPAISLDALEQMVSRLDLDLSGAQVRASFRANADATAPRLSWHSVALHVARCLRPHRRLIEDALAVLAAAAASPSSPAATAQNTVTTDQLRTTLLTLRDKLGLDTACIAALVHRAQVLSEGSKRIDYKRFLASVCSGLEASAAPPPHALVARQQIARQLEGSRSRDVAKQIAADWKALDEKERAKYEALAAKDHERYCREKQEEITRLKRRQGLVVDESDLDSDAVRARAGYTLRERER